MSKAVHQAEFKLKVLRAGTIPAALQRAERYRLLNEPTQAESICLDVLEVEPKNQSALILLLLALTDQFGHSHSHAEERALALPPGLVEEYSHAYYEGIIYERRARARLDLTVPGGASAAYHLLREAMRCYEAAEKIRPEDNDEAVLRWNTCARTIMAEHLEPAPVEDSIIMSE